MEILLFICILVFAVLCMVKLGYNNFQLRQEVMRLDQMIRQSTVKQFDLSKVPKVGLTQKCAHITLAGCVKLKSGEDLETVLARLQREVDKL